MMSVSSSGNKPPVSLIVTPCRQRGNLLCSLRSATSQHYPNLQIILANDGSEGLAELAASLRDLRPVVCPAPSGRTTGQMLNVALGLAGGQYVAYLAGGDMHYPFHVGSLVAALEAAPECQVAYGDFYRTYCKLSDDARPIVLGKAVAGGGDFDRMLLCRQDCVRLSAMMCRRNLLDRAGGFDEDLPALAGWDFLRRLAFFTDFIYVPQVTGECYRSIDGDKEAPAPGCANDQVMAQCVQTIRAKRPPKPWPKMPDLSIIFAPHRFDASAVATIERIRCHTFVPYQVYLPVSRRAPKPLQGDIPGIVAVPVGGGAPADVGIDKALCHCEGEYVAVIVGEAAPGPGWVEFPLHALMKSSPDQAFVIPDQPEETWAAVFHKDQLLRARRVNPALSIRRSVQAAGIVIRHPAPLDHPLAQERLLVEARRLQQEGSWRQAAEVYYCRALEVWRESPLVRRQALRALYHTGRQEEAIEASRDLNQRHPTVHTLLLEGKLLRRANRTNQAVAVLREAQAALARG